MAVRGTKQEVESEMRAFRLLDVHGGAVTLQSRFSRRAVDLRAGGAASPGGQADG